MELALVLRELLNRRKIVAAGVAVALLAAVLSVYRVSSSGLAPRSITQATASTEVLVDSYSTSLGNLAQDLPSLQTRATVLANFMASPAMLDVIGQQVGLSGDQIYAAGPVDPAEPRTVQEPSASKRNVQVTGETIPYRLTFATDPNLPQIGIFAQAPTTAFAVSLANAAVTGVQRYLAGLEVSEGVPPRLRVVIRPLGAAHGAVDNGGIAKSLALLVFGGVLALWCVLVLVVDRFAKNWRASRTLYADLRAGPEQIGSPADASALANGGISSNSRGLESTLSDAPVRSNGDAQSPVPVAAKLGAGHNDGAPHPAEPALSEVGIDGPKTGTKNSRLG
jgi:hypothetical protein